MSSTLRPTVSPSSAALTPNAQVTAVADKDTPLTASSPTLSSIKDLRAFEHDRQRAKKAADLVKMRARKGQGRWGSLAKGGLYNSSKKSATPVFSEKHGRLGTDEAFDGLLADSCDLGTVASRDVFKLAQPEVRLSDLVTFRKPSKGLDGDFVVVPHRSVIVLDDIATHDLLIDEPWEHIYGSDEEESAATTPTKGPSYAAILSSTK